MNYAEEVCRSRGIKLTLQRILVLNVMHEACDHPDAEDVYNRLSKLDQSHSKISLATVYRTLNLFESKGVLRRLEIGDGKARFEFIKDNITHHHLINLENHTIIEFSAPELDQIANLIARRFGYTIVKHKFELYGIPQKRSDVNNTKNAKSDD